MMTLASMVLSPTIIFLSTKKRGNGPTDLEIYGKIIKPFEELEKLYSNYPEPDRINYHANHIILALNSYDPTKTINNAINFNRKLTGRAKIMYYVSIYLRMNPVQAESYLTNLIKSRPYFRTVKVDKL